MPPGVVADKYVSTLETWGTGQRYSDSRQISPAALRRHLGDSDKSCRVSSHRATLRLDRAHRACIASLWTLVSETRLTLRDSLANCLSSRRESDSSRRSGLPGRRFRSEK